MKPRPWWIGWCLAIILGMTGPGRGDTKSKAAREAAEYVLRKFGKEAAQHGLETWTRKIEALALRHGDEALTVVKKVGPRAFGLVEEAGQHGGLAVKLMARHGEGAVWVVSRPKRLALFVRFGDEAAEALMKHREVAEPVLEAYAQPAASALKVISTKNGRRIAMLADEGSLARAGRGEELLRVVGRYGDRAVEFLWKHQEALFAPAALTTFLSAPEAFLDGTRPITEFAAADQGSSTTESPGTGVATGYRGVVWAGALLLCAAAGGLFLRRKSQRRSRSGNSSSIPTENV